MSVHTNITLQKNVFLAVIHVEGGIQALRNARIAQEGGADGIFLINHSIPYPSLIECYEKVRAALPDYWIGLNCLDLGMQAVNIIPKDTQGLWVDNAGITEENNPVAGAEEFALMRAKSGWKGLYFGGVAFKYQKEIVDVEKAAQLARPFVDVITTSGPGTGESADLTKIQLMKKGCGKHPLATASGTTIENVRMYMPYVQYFLVATGISHSHTELDPVRVRALAHILKSE